MHNSDNGVLVLEKVGLSDLSKVAEKIIACANGCKVWILNGEMGVGKTTFIKEVCDCFGVVDNVHSPTFSIINEYENDFGEPLYHFDF